MESDLLIHPIRKAESKHTGGFMSPLLWPARLAYSSGSTTSWASCSAPQVQLGQQLRGGLPRSAGATAVDTAEEEYKNMGPAPLIYNPFNLI